MKYLIAGIGNMGPDYEGTRHNIGFEVVDTLARRFDTEFANEYLCDLARIKYKGRTLVMIKPSTYVNRSGKAVRYWMQKEKVEASRLLVIVDDLNLPFGSIRLRGKGSHGGHNGLKDISEKLGHDNYSRLRIGLGQDFYKGQQVNFVLGQWSEKEKEELPKILDKCAEAVLSFSTIGLSRTMSEFNG